MRERTYDAYRVQNEGPSNAGMAPAVVHQVEVLLEPVVVVVWLAEDAVRWCVITVTRTDIWLATVETPLRHVGIVGQ